MFVCVVSLSQCSSRDLLYVKCLCVLSRYPSAVVEICYMLNVCVCCLVVPVPVFCVLSRCPSIRDLLYDKCFCVLSRCPSAVVEICYMLNVCVCCLVVPVQ